MIPGDLASRLRMLTEASFFSGEPTVAPLARVKGIPDQFPDVILLMNDGTELVERLFD